MAAKSRILLERCQRFDPFFGGGREKTVDAMFYEGLVNADGASYDGQSAGHVLNEFVAAFATLKGLVGQRHDSYVKILDFGYFDSLGPGMIFEVYPLQREITPADLDDMHVSTCTEFVKCGLDQLEVRGGYRGTNPADGEGVIKLVVELVGWLVAGGVYDRGEKFDAFGTSFLGMGGEVVIANDNDGGVAHDGVNFPA